MNAQDLKNSILQLAVQGKLVEQRLEEGTAKELLAQIKAEKEQLIKDKKIKKEKPLPEITDEEIPFEIPESWEWVRLGEIVSVYGGKRIPAGTKLTEEDTGHKYIRVADMKDGSVKIDDIKYISEEIYQKIKQYYITSNDVYITVAGTIGRVGTIPEELNMANLTENADKLVFNNLDKSFLCIMLSSNVVQYQIREATTQVGQPKLAILRIQKLVVPLPPLEEQKRIVAKIEEILPYIEQYDKAYTKLEAFNKKFPEDMKKSILQMAMQGKLVEQRPEEGTADELYEQIVAGKARLIKEGKIKKEKPLPEITEDEIPFDIPESWKWVRLGKIGSLTRGSGIKRTETQEEGFPCIRYGELYTTYKTKFGKALSFVDEEIYEKSHKITKGDIAMTLTGENKTDIAMALTYEGDEDVAMGGDMTCWSHHMMEPLYLVYLMNSPYGISCKRKLATGDIIIHISNDKLSSIPIPIPPLAEQKRIVAKLEQMLPYCDRLIK